MAKQTTSPTLFVPPNKNYNSMLARTIGASEPVYKVVDSQTFNYYRESIKVPLIKNPALNKKSNIELKSLTEKLAVDSTKDTTKLIEGLKNNLDFAKLPTFKKVSEEMKALNEMISQGIPNNIPLGEIIPYIKKLNNELISNFTKEATQQFEDYIKQAEFKNNLKDLGVDEKTLTLKKDYEANLTSIKTDLEKEINDSQEEFRKKMLAELLRLEILLPWEGSITPNTQGISVGNKHSSDHFKNVSLDELHITLGRHLIHRSDEMVSLELLNIPGEQKFLAYSTGNVKTHELNFEAWALEAMIKLQHKSPPFAIRIESTVMFGESSRNPNEPSMHVRRIRELATKAYTALINAGFKSSDLMLIVNNSKQVKAAAYIDAGSSAGKAENFVKERTNAIEAKNSRILEDELIKRKSARPNLVVDQDSPNTEDKNLPNNQETIKKQLTAMKNHEENLKEKNDVEGGANNLSQSSPIIPKG